MFSQCKQIAFVQQTVKERKKNIAHKTYIYLGVFICSFVPCLPYLSLPNTFNFVRGPCIHHIGSGVACMQEQDTAIAKCNFRRPEMSFVFDQWKEESTWICKACEPKTMEDNNKKKIVESTQTIPYYSVFIEVCAGACRC